MKCGNCGREAKDNETFCSNCGLRLTGKNNTRKIGIIIGIIIAVAGIMMAIVISNSIVNNQRVTTLYDKASSDFYDEMDDEVNISDNTKREVEEVVNSSKKFLVSTDTKNNVDKLEKLMNQYLALEEAETSIYNTNDYDSANDLIAKINRDEIKNTSRYEYLVERIDLHEKRMENKEKLESKLQELLNSEHYNTLSQTFGYGSVQGVCGTAKLASEVQEGEVFGFDLWLTDYSDNTFKLHIDTSSSDDWHNSLQEMYAAVKDGSTIGIAALIKGSLNKIYSYSYWGI